MTSLRHLAGGSSIDEAIGAAVAELSAGLPPHPTYQLRLDQQRVASILQGARSSQLPVLARRLADEPLPTRGINEQDQKSFAVGQVAREAANDLLAALNTSGRVLARFRDEKVRKRDFALFLALVGIAEADAWRLDDQAAGSGGLLAHTLVDVPSAADFSSLGPVLGTMWRLMPAASAADKSGGEKLRGLADEQAQTLLPDFRQELAKVAREVSDRISLHDFLGAVLRAGSRRLAYLDGARARP